VSEYSALVLADGPTGYWRLNETTGTVAGDSSGNSRNGTHTGVTLNATSLLVNDPADGAASYDGATSKTIIAGGAAGLVGGSMTIEGWIRTPSAQVGSQGIFGLRTDSSTGDFYILLFGSTLEARFTNSAGAQTTLSPTVPYDGNVHYFAMTYDSVAGTLTIVIDGAVPTGGTATGLSGTITVTTSDFLIGMVSSLQTSNFFAGPVDDVAIYNKALTSTQLIAHHTQGIAAPSTFPVAPGDRFRPYWRSLLAQ
jgi:hypothetical protein